MGEVCTGGRGALQALCPNLGFNMFLFSLKMESQIMYKLDCMNAYVVVCPYFPAAIYTGNSFLKQSCSHPTPSPTPL